MNPVALRSDALAVTLFPPKAGQVGNFFPFSRPKGGGFPLSFDSAQDGACSPELALNEVKGWVPIPPWRDESLINNAVHEDVRKPRPIYIDICA